MHTNRPAPVTFMEEPEDRIAAELKIEKQAKMADDDASIGFLDLLPSALLATILTKLDVASICSIASTCRTFKSYASQILSYLPVFHLLEITPTKELLGSLLPPNPYLRSLKVDCGQLDDSAIQILLRPSLHELSLHNCVDFSGKLLSEIGGQCKGLRSLYLGSVAGNRGRAVHLSDLEELLKGCSQLESLILMFEASLFLRRDFPKIWAFASEKLTSLEIGYIASVMVTELFWQESGINQVSFNVVPSIFLNIQKLCLSVDSISDSMVDNLSKALVNLSHLDLRDAPFIEPRVSFDLTNSGLLHINHYGKLKHLSLVRSQEFMITFFRRVNDQGVLFLADKCAKIESICLGGFCRVTDTGFKTILHSCSNLRKLKVSHGTQLTDIVFHDISATSLSLVHISLRWCNLLTNQSVINLASNRDLEVLDLRNCRKLGDDSLQAISSISKLKILLLDGSDITDKGLFCLRSGVINSLVSFSVRGCKRLTSKFISLLFEGSTNLKLRELDLSNLPQLSDAAVLLLAKQRIPIVELRLRQCPLIGDASIMALASMQADGYRWYGSSLQLLDLYNCGGITPLAFRWFKNPYFPKLRWLGVTGSVNRDIVDALARSRPFLHVSCRGEELGPCQWDKSIPYMHEEEEEVVEDLEQWVLEAAQYIADEEEEDEDEDNEEDEDLEDAETDEEPLE